MKSKTLTINIDAFFYPTLLLVAVFFSFVDQAQASRIGRFYSQAINDITVSAPIADTVKSTCTIAITNNSSVSQFYTILALTGSASTTTGSIDAFSGGATYVAATLDAAYPVVTGTSSISTGANSGTLLAGDTVVYVYNFTTMNTNTNVGTQTVRCVGTISVDDAVTGSVGFVSASGSLTTFNQAGSDRGGGGHSGSTKGQIMFTELPISVADGKPF